MRRLFEGHPKEQHLAVASCTRCFRCDIHSVADTVRAISRLASQEGQFAWPGRQVGTITQSSSFFCLSILQSSLAQLWVAQLPQWRVDIDPQVAVDWSKDLAVTHDAAGVWICWDLQTLGLGSEAGAGRIFRWWKFSGKLKI